MEAGPWSSPFRIRHTEGQQLQTDSLLSAIPGKAAELGTVCHGLACCIKRIWGNQGEGKKNISQEEPSSWLPSEDFGRSKPEEWSELLGFWGESAAKMGRADG